MSGRCLASTAAVGWRHWPRRRSSCATPAPQSYRASEFCGTSISSLGPAQSDVDAARPFNPHVHYARADQRGYMRFRLDARQLQAEVRVVDDARRAGSGIGTAARLVVSAARPGIEPG